MISLKCTECGKEYDAYEAVWRCTCGELLDLPLLDSFEPGKLYGRQQSMWRYREVLPVKDDKNIVTFQEGFTPLLEIFFGKKKVLIKQDHLFPTGSYKDRGATVLVSKIRELGVNHVVEDSSGNAGAAIAAYCARGSITCDIFVPDSTSQGKINQIKNYGVNLHRISGGREQTAREALKAADSLFYASHSWNPYFFQGTKTFAYEVCEQLGWKAPDVLILPVGNGTLFLGAFIGFKELRSRGVIDFLPRFIGIQSEACAPLAEAFRLGAGSPSEIESSPTIAEGIAIESPVRGKQILKAITETKGSFITVSDEDITGALHDMYKQGFYIEPTSAAAIAGVKKFLKTNVDAKTIVSAFTGHGLKSVKGTLYA